MSLRLVIERIRCILMFFIDYKLLICCFTILSLTVSASILFERVLFEGEIITLRSVFYFFLPGIIFNLFFTVSYRLFCGVYFFRTILISLFIPSFLVIPFLYLKFLNMEKEIQNFLSFTGKNVWIEGVIVSQEKSNTFLFHSGRDGLGNSLIRFEEYPVLHVGQRCKLNVKVVEPKSFKDFDYKKYLFRKGIYSILDVNSYECNNGGDIALEIRYGLERIVEKALSEPEASLLIGIMFGSKRVFRSDFNTALSNSGVSHIIAASGYNVALVADTVDRVTKNISGRCIVLLKILCIWMFSLFSGLSSSLIRASTMTSLYLFAIFFKRESNKGCALIVCVTVLMLLNPFLIHDVGFLFSFASTAGLIFLPKCFESVRSEFFKNAVLPTLTCILFTLPISVMFFGKVSTISLISNIVVLPIVNSTIFWGVGITILNIFFNIKVLYLIPYIQLNIFKYFVLISSNIPMMEIGIDRELLFFAVYGLLFLFCLIKYPVSSNNYYLRKAKRYE